MRTLRLLTGCALLAAPLRWLRGAEEEALAAYNGSGGEGGYGRSV